jgi:catechol 2,3-dioxygenase-like lactoylglutathione lyase family enzyme
VSPVALDAIGIVAADPPRTVAFYKLLGIELVQYEDSGHYEAKAANGMRVMMDTIELIKSFDPAFEKKHGTGVTICFKLDSANAVDELHATIAAAGHRTIKAPWDAFWGHRYACVADPDGNQIDLFAPL